MKIYIGEYLNGKRVVTELESTECRLDHRRNSLEPGRIFHFGAIYTPTRIFRDPEGVRLEQAKALPREIAKHALTVGMIEWKMYRETD